ncbi:hypothetical protein [Jiangella mangrovi]|uniref:DUF2127 domain-containing protein n=1 Tax=Jiangella mangrovi TaxID=1524084 RepID=A0A7W9GQL4_9ACTN|nr:hypothetical protein [Jiangella mangrovi]MBB5788092.1 hypothetical protein [Jiangella mangrovi]
MSATVPGNDGVSVLRPPGEILTAVRLMYLGAALTALMGVLRALDPDAFEDALADSAGTEVSGASMRGTYLFFLLVVAGLWLLVARGCRRGRGRYRVLATVFAAVYVLATLATLVSAPRFDAYNVVSGLVAVVAVAVTWLLYRPEARRWFASRTPPTS